MGKNWDGLKATWLLLSDIILSVSSLGNFCSLVLGFLRLSSCTVQVDPEASLNCSLKRVHLPVIILSSLFGDCTLFVCYFLYR